MGALIAPLIGLVSTVVGGLLSDSGSPAPLPPPPEAPAADTAQDEKDAKERTESEAERLRSAKRRAAAGPNITGLGSEEITKKTLLGS